MIGEPRRLLAMATSKGLSRLIRRVGRGGGTALPGLVATKIQPDLLDRLAGRLPSGNIVIAGTNGKTTTSRMLADMLAASGLKVIHNRSGSNLVRGIAAAFAEQMPLFSTTPDIAVIETDENAFAEVVARSKPRVVVLLNLFRDQLDRYGELETIAASWRPVLTSLTSETILVVNGDDPNLSGLADESPARVVRFGLETQGHKLTELPHAADAATCRVCGARLNYETIYLSHLGNYQCPNCGNHRPSLDFSVTGIEPASVERQQLKVRDVAGSEVDIELPIPGIYNVYNAVAAIGTSRVLGIADDVVCQALAAFQTAFGRLEIIRYEGLELTLALAKNPVGFNEVLRMVAELGNADAIVVGINDLDADGRDVSWLWDVDFETLASGAFTGDVIAAGIRGDDLAVRMKYAGLPAARLDATMTGQRYDRLLDHLLETRQSGERIFLLLTYTSLLALRKSLADRGIVKAFWNQ